MASLHFVSLESLHQVIPGPSYLNLTVMSIPCQCRYPSGGEASPLSYRQASGR